VKQHSYQLLCFDGLLQHSQRLLLSNACVKQLFHAAGSIVTGAVTQLNCLQEAPRARLCCQHLHVMQLD
jgi:hypothetical protein